MRCVLSKLTAVPGKEEICYKHPYFIFSSLIPATCMGSTLNIFSRGFFRLLLAEICSYNLTPMFPVSLLCI